MKLRAIEGVGDHIVLALVREWQSPDAVLRASAGDLIERGCSTRLAEAIVRGPDRDACRRIARELHDIERTRIEVRSMLDPNYPARLLMIPDPPPLLYVAGSLHAPDELAIAIVGCKTRNSGRTCGDRTVGQRLGEARVHDRQRAGTRRRCGRASRRACGRRSNRRCAGLRSWTERIRQNISGFVTRSRSMEPSFRNYPFGRPSTQRSFSSQKPHHQRAVVRRDCDRSGDRQRLIDYGEIGRRPGARGLCGSGIRERRNEPRNARLDQRGCHLGRSRRRM